MTIIKLFCFAHAGGSAMGYSRWRKLLGPGIEICPLELRGHGPKTGQPFYDSVQAAVEDLYPALVKEAGTDPYALLGHSMGTLLVYEMCRHIKRMGFREPVASVFSGRTPPHVVRDRKQLHELPDQEFKDEIRALGLTPDEVFEHAELMAMFLPIIRSDYRLIETYAYGEIAPPLTSDVFVWTGKEDELTRERMDEWAQVTSGQCHYREFKGGHFFLYEQTPAVIATLQKDLMAASGSGATAIQSRPPIRGGYA
ncbi:thioesterase II family protein [Paenibacillus sp. MMS18-CY102]|uniref:thioesterase II family protein n=1 Tax=Paenibacillus sp. MMS18-CY102 TaxID=2682849 RepID=UPI0013667735|nr:alpha/beta fold hydrolase [Paenibacillus sp. MMS18-CY102]MWC30348.1 alpha/beta fold hydrolase [Paenibacillus sp. MMS18-CY102]